jgi:uncharacterized iron-regulated membrane protein
LVVPEIILMRQALGYASLLIATGAVAYVVWVLWTAFKEFSNVPKDQVGYVFLQNLHRYKGRFAIFFVFVAAELVDFVVIAVTSPR